MKRAIAVSKKPRAIKQAGRLSFTVHSSIDPKNEDSDLIDVYTDLDRVVRTDLHYHYSGPTCAYRWISLCDDPDYGHHALVHEIDAALPQILETIQAHARNSFRVSLISLGPGTGAVDIRVLRKLEMGPGVACYYGLDFSFELLKYSINKIAGTTFGRQFPIRAICGDFTKIPTTLCDADIENSIRLFLLVGFTVGNYRETSLLKKIAALMSDQDYLLFDARLHDLSDRSDQRQLTPNQRKRLLQSYEQESVKRFVFGPVEVATYARAEDVDFHYELVDEMTSVPQAINIMIGCSGLDTTMRMTGEPVKRERLRLAATTLYNSSALVSYLCSLGFNVVWQQNADRVGFFLLRRIP